MIITAPAALIHPAGSMWNPVAGGMAFAGSADSRVADMSIYGLEMKWN